MKVLSLFDGMGCLGIALKDMGYEFEYYTSEIDKHAISQSKVNFPNSVQLGDVTKWKQWDIDWSKIDVIGAGSPCQGFSFAGKQLAFDDPRSALFFVFVEILEHIKKHNPKVIFLLENVKMKKEHELVITRYVNVAPIEINAALVSAQNRVRLFWTNIANEPYGLFGDMQCTIPQPEDRGILLKDILENDVPDKYYLSDKMLNYFSNRAANFNQGKVNIREEEGKASTITASMASCDISDNFIAIDCSGKEYKDKTGTVLSRYAKGPTNFGSETYIKVNTNLKKASNQEKANCFTAGGNSGGLHSDKTLIVASRGRNSENPKSRKAGLPTEQQLEPRTDGKTNCITSVQKDNLVVHIIPQTVSVRKYEVDIESLKILIKSHKNDTITNIAKKIDRPKTEVEHWFRSDNSFAIPSSDIWLQLKDILDIKTDVHDKSILEFEEKENTFEQSNRVYDVNSKNPTLLAGKKDNLILQLNPSTESGGKQPYQQNRIYDTNGKNPALCCGQEQWGGNAILIPEATKKGYTEVNPGECFDFTMPTSETRRGRLMENKSNCITAAKFDFMQYTQDFKIRRLTPTECARLQSIPAWYKWNCSDTQAYKMLGNGWNVEVIKHILKHI
jgi:DNA-cytosine methyltransferase